MLRRLATRAASSAGAAALAWGIFWSPVAFAQGGPAPHEAGGEGPSPPVRPFATIHTEVAHVDLRADEPGQTFHLQVGTAAAAEGHDVDLRGFESLCTAPCSADIPVGYHRFGLSGPDGKTVEATQDTRVPGNATLRGSVVRNGGWRGVGIGLIVAGPIAGVAMLVMGLSRHHSVCDQFGNQPASCIDMPDVDYGLAYGGLLTGFASVSAGVLLVVLVKDYATFELDSGVAFAPLRYDGTLGSTTREGGKSAPGLTATMRF